MAQLYGGKLNDFADSMALAIEDAFTQVRLEAGLDPLPSGDTRDRRILFIAIARGVINHLKAKETAFLVTVATSDAHVHNASTTLDVRS